MNRRNAERQFQMMGQWNQMNPQFMMQPHIFDFQRFRQREMQQDDARQQQWWENYWRNWDRPDSAMMRRIEEGRKRYQSQDSIWQQRRQQFAPQNNNGSPFTPPFGGGPQFPQSGAPGRGGSQFRPGSNH